MNDAAAISEIEARAERAEAAALESQIQLAVTRARIAELEATAAKRRDADAERAVRKMVLAGDIGKGDTFTQHEYKAKFITDPSLIFLAVTKPFNMKTRVTK